MCLEAITKTVSQSNLILKLTYITYLYYNQCTQQMIKQLQSMWLRHGHSIPGSMWQIRRWFTGDVLWVCTLWHSWAQQWRWRARRTTSANINFHLASQTHSQIHNYIYTSAILSVRNYNSNVAITVVTIPATVTALMSVNIITRLSYNYIMFTMSSSSPSSPHYFQVIIEENRKS